MSDESIRFYAGADLPLLWEFFSDAAETMPYPMDGATVSVIDAPNADAPTITNPTTGAYQTLWSGAQTADWPKRKPVQVQLKAVLVGGAVIISPPVTLVPL